MLGFRPGDESPVVTDELAVVKLHGAQQMLEGFTFTAPLQQHAEGL